MRAGLLRRMVTVEQNNPTTDDTGAPVDVWTTLATGWGDVRPMDTGTEKFASAQPFSEHYYTIRIRWTEAMSVIEPKMRVNANGKIFDIERVHDKCDRHRQIIIFARVINDDGI